MRRPIVIAALLAFAAASARAEPPSPAPPGEAVDDPASLPQGENLLPNGDFEQGEITPDGWQSVDGLSSFWVEADDPARGRVLRFDTDVLQSQAYAWWKEIHAGASPEDAPSKQLTVEPKYDTLAGLDGTWFFSDAIAIEPDKSYWLTVDARGPAMLCWLVGYPEEPDESFGADAAAFQGYLQKERGEFVNARGREPFIHQYVWKGQLAIGGDTENWRTYSRRTKPFRPTRNTPNVRHVRVLLFHFWPPGEYEIDNVRLVEVEE